MKQAAVALAAVAIIAVTAGALLWERAKPTAGEIRARDVSAAATAAADVARAQADMAEAPARAGAMTVLIVAGVLSGAILALGGASAVVRWLHGRASVSVVTWAPGDSAIVQAPASAVVLPARTTAAQLAAPAPVTAPLLAAPQPAACPTWAALGWQPVPGRILLGWADGAPIVGALPDLLSVGVVGRSGTGKSTLLRLVVLQALAIGADVRVFDPHGSITDDLPGLPVADTIGLIESQAGQVLAELDRRIAGRLRHERALLLIGDELPAWAGSAPTAQEALRRVILEGRKVGLFAFISGQGLPAALFASGTLARDALSSRYVFAASAAVARQVGLDAEIARQAPGLPTGRAILDGRVVGSGGPRVIDVPWVSVDDVARALPARPALQAPGSATVALQGAGDSATPALQAPGSATVALPGPGDSATPALQAPGDDVARVRAYMQAGMSRTAAISAVVGAPGGRRWGEIAAAIKRG